MSINMVSLSGNLTRNAEIKATKSGAIICHISLAVNDSKKNKESGKWETYPNYVDCIMFGNRAEKLSPYLTKGVKVCINGKLHYTSWIKDDENRSKLEVIIDDIDLMQSAHNKTNNGKDR